MKRRFLVALIASSVVATGCTITIGHPPTSDSPAAGDQPVASPSPHATGIPGAPGPIAVLDDGGTLTAFDADGSDAGRPGSLGPGPDAHPAAGVVAGRLAHRLGRDRPPTGRPPTS